MKCIPTQFQMDSWFSCQIDKKTLFQVRNGDTQCRRIKIEAKMTKISGSELDDYPGEPRWCLSLCKASDFHVYLIGGKIDGSRQTSCMRFNLSSCAWEDGMPPMSVTRSGASSCSLGGHMYVFCGTSSNGSFLDSIECLKLYMSANKQRENCWMLLSQK